ncbi:hypothetical protein Pen01_78790 [Phytomonospora endophytica]|nr:hypothetical protein Pen01_78790 [Phytomonospora endophytica]
MIGGGVRGAGRMREAGEAKTHALDLFAVGCVGSHRSSEAEFAASRIPAVDGPVDNSRVVDNRAAARSA